MAAGDCVFKPGQYRPGVSPIQQVPQAKTRPNGRRRESNEPDAALELPAKLESENIVVPGLFRQYAPIAAIKVRHAIELPPASELGVDDRIPRRIREDGVGRRRRDGRSPFENRPANDFDDGGNGMACGAVAEAVAAPQAISQYVSKESR